MARETIVRAKDDLELKKNPQSTAEAQRRVDISMTVYDLDDKPLPNESLELRSVDLSKANTDLLKDSMVQRGWDAGTRTQGSQSAGRSSGNGRRSPAREGGSGRSSGGGGVTSQTAAFNKAVRLYAADIPKWSEISPQGRLPRPLVVEFLQQNPNWVQEYFKGEVPEGTQVRKIAEEEGLLTGGTPTSNSEPTPTSNVDPQPAVDDDENDLSAADEDPPLDQTDDADWTGQQPTQYA